MFATYETVKNVRVVDWEVEGEYHEDTYYPTIVYYVVAEIAGGVVQHGRRYEAMVSIHSFTDPERAEALARRVEAAGRINPDHWYIHDFFSLSLEARLNEEAHHEELHRKGYGHLSNGVFSSGHD